MAKCVLCLALPPEQQAEISVVSHFIVFVQIAKCICLNGKMCAMFGAMPPKQQAEISVVSPTTFLSSDHIRLDFVKMISDKIKLQTAYINLN